MVTEYHFLGSENFIVEVDKLSVEEIISQLEELLRAYRMFKLRGNDDDADVETVRELERKANIAWDTFHSMFRGRLAQEEFLLEETEATILGMFRTMITDLQPSCVEGQQIVNSLEECSSLLMQLTTQQTSGQDTALWPYIRKIRLVNSSRNLMIPQ